MTDEALIELRSLLDRLQQGQNHLASPNYEAALSSAFAETEIHDPFEEVQSQREDLADYDSDERHAMVEISPIDAPVSVSNVCWSNEQIENQQHGGQAQQLEPTDCKILTA